MNDRLATLEEQLSALSKKVEQLERALGAQLPESVDGKPLANEAPSAEPSPAALPVAAAVQPVAAEGVAGRSIQLVGRSFLVFGGAFLIRALTDGRHVNAGVGVSLGLLFAASGVALAWRDASRQPLSAAFHGITAALVGFPLIFETGVRLALLPPNVATGVLAIFTAGLLAAATRNPMRSLAWVAVLGALATALALRAMQGGPALPGVLFALAVATLVLAERQGWTGLRWPVALVLDAVVLRRLFASAALEPAARQTPLEVELALAVLVFLLFLSAMFRRIVVKGSAAGAFEILQGLLAMGTAIACIARTSAELPWGLPVGSAMFFGVAGASLYALLKVSSEPSRTIDAGWLAVLWFLSTLAFGLLLTRGPMVGLLWAVIGLAAVLLGTVRHRLKLWSAALAFNFAAAVGGGLSAVSRDALLRNPSLDWSAPSIWTLSVLVLIVFSGTLMARSRPQNGWGGHALSAGALWLLALGLVSVTASAMRTLLGGAQADVAYVVLSRTFLLVTVALGLGVARKISQRVELGWVAWAFLVMGALKLLVQDLPLGRASTLFVAFPVLGLAIIVLPRLTRSNAPAPVLQKS